MGWRACLMCHVHPKYSRARALIAYLERIFRPTSSTSLQMAKRLADDQITRENVASADEDNEDVRASLAPPVVMAKRKILQPKGKGYHFNVSTEAKFSGTITSLPEGKAVKLKALSRKFVESLKEPISDDVVPDYRPVVHKFLKYYQEIEESIPSPQGSNKTPEIATQKKNPFADFASPASTPRVSSEKLHGEDGVETSDAIRNGDRADRTQIQGPVFKMTSVPLAKRNIFSFDKDKAANESRADSDTDTASEIEIKGPSFTFNKKINDPVFKLQNDAVNDVQKSKNPMRVATESSQSMSDLRPGHLACKTADETSEKTSLIDVPTTDDKLLPSSGDSYLETSGKAEGRDTGSEDLSQGKAANAASAEEEKEETLFKVRAKLMMLKPDDASNPYQNVGVGELKVLKDQENQTSRVLLRADGGLRLLLNTRLIKDVEYATFGNGAFVRFPTLNESRQIVTYVLKVGSPENGEKLSKILNSAKAL
ncbi:hypothetical protein OXX69_012182 [Metschnikowia pulcherrima]